MEWFDSVGLGWVWFILVLVWLHPGLVTNAIGECGAQLKGCDLNVLRSTSVGSMRFSLEVGSDPGVVDAVIARIERQDSVGSVKEVNMLEDEFM